MHKAFLITEDAAATLEGAASAKVGGVYVHRTPNLPATEVTFNGEPATMLGWPLHLTADARLDDESLRDIAGMWLLVTAEGVRPDPLAGIPCVFDTVNRAAASTPAHLPLKPTEDTELTAMLNLPEEANWFPFGLTPFVGVTRLLPNHRLDFSDWASWREFHPVAPVSVEGGVAIIAASLAQNLQAITGAHKISLGITAGNETRMLLAALPAGADAYGFTFGKSGDLDARDGGKAAALAGVAHEVRPNAVDSVESAAWFERVGHCVAGQTMKNAAAKAKLPTDRVLIKGIGGEIMRGYYHSSDANLSPSALLSDMGLPDHPRLRGACKEWLAGRPADDVLHTLDLLYWENRVGAWASPQVFAELAPLATMFPLNDRRIIDAMLGLPPEGKRKDIYPRMVVQALRPELLRVPINGGGPARRFASKVLRKLGVG